MEDANGETKMCWGDMKKEFDTPGCRTKPTTP